MRAGKSTGVAVVRVDQAEVPELGALVEVGHARRGAAEQGLRQAVHRAGQGEAPGEGGDLLPQVAGAVGRQQAETKSRQAASYSALGTAHSVRRLASRSAFSCQATTRSRKALTPSSSSGDEVQRPGADQGLVEHELVAHRPARRRPPAPCGAARSAGSSAAPRRPIPPGSRTARRGGRGHPRRACGRASRWPAGRGGSSSPAPGRRRGRRPASPRSGRGRSRPRCARSAGRSGRRRCPRRDLAATGAESCWKRTAAAAARAAAPAAGCAAARRRASRRAGRAAAGRRRGWSGGRRPAPSRGCACRLVAAGRRSRRRCGRPGNATSTSTSARRSAVRVKSRVARSRPATRCSAAAVRVQLGGEVVAQDLPPGLARLVLEMPGAAGVLGPERGQRLLAGRVVQDAARPRP